MFSFIHGSTARAALMVAGVALLAAPAAMASQQKEISYWAQSQTASRVAGTTQYASKAGGTVQYASKAGGTVQYASQAGDRKYGAAADQALNTTTQNPAFQLASQAGDRKWGAAADQQSS